MAGWVTFRRAFRDEVQRLDHNKLVFCISIPCVRRDCARDLQIGLTDGMGRDIRHAYNDMQSRPGAKWDVVKIMARFT
jgi:hypothetical protein